MDRSELDFRLRAVPAAVFVDILRKAGGPLDARALKRRLEDLGVERAVVDAAWRRAQPGVRRHGNVVLDGARHAYGWSDAPAPVPMFSPRAALDELIKPRVPAAAKAEAADVVQAALRERDEQQVRQRKVTNAAVRAFAEAAMDVEEAAAAGVDIVATVDRIRALAKHNGLTPIGRAGESAEFNPKLHASRSGDPAAGAAVRVLRPGYLWRDGDEEILLAKAQVAPPKRRATLLHRKR